MRNKDSIAFPSGDSDQEGEHEENNEEPEASETTDTSSEIGPELNGSFGFQIEQEIQNARGDIAEGEQNTAASQVGSSGPSRAHDPQEDLEASNQTETETIRDKGISDISDDESLVKEPDWAEETERIYQDPETDLELLQMVDSFLDSIDEDLQIARERERAGEHYRVSDKFNNETTTQSQLAFDHVRDDGIIVDGDTLYGLQEVTPTRWESEDTEGKKNIMGAYIAFLKALQWGIAIPCYPKAFDFDKYLEAIYKAGTQAITQGAHPVLDIGRRYHIMWADREIDPEKIKRKEFYVVCSVNKSTMKKAMAGRGQQTMIGLGISWLTNRLTSDEDEDLINACEEEIRQRQQTMKNELTKTGVEVKQITDRQTSMEYLYHYYNHVEPVLDKFEHGTMSNADFSTEVMSQ